MVRESLKYTKYPFRHKLISFVRDIDVRGFRKLSVLLPKFLLPNPKSVGEHILETNDGLKLIINPSIDNGVELSLFQTGTYEKGILRFIEQNFEKKGCFIDVGANIGLMSIFAATRFTSAEIISFEAHPVTADLLRKNIQLNDLTNIEVRQYALGNEVGKVKLFDNWHVNRGGASVVVNQEGGTYQEVDMFRMDDVLKDGIPTMIKIDVEGVELEVLKGGASLIEKHTPTLIVEVSENRINRHNSSHEIVSFIKELGPYKIYKLKGGKERKSKLVEIVHPQDLPNHDNIICIAQK